MEIELEAISTDATISVVQKSLVLQKLRKAARQLGHDLVPLEGVDYRVETPCSFVKKLTNIPPSKQHKVQNLWYLFWTFLGCFAAVSTVGCLSEFVFAPNGFPIIYGALGASSSLIFAKPELVTSQPINMLVGHSIPPCIGIVCQLLFPDTSWLAAALAVSVSVTIMELIDCQNPPGGAMALLYVTTEVVHTQQFQYVLATLFSFAILMVCALIFNNLPKSRVYPQYWIPWWK
eukprot:GILK01009776.1.p1 GENE.GILK01009776.1~~GILK01009776.1.p1  ORF type:complete len:233 (+),score=13.41 GILK01009776.1:51-749(+)